MVNKIFILIFVFFLYTNWVVLQDRNNDRLKRQEELSQIKSEINNLNQKISEIKAKQLKESSLLEYFDEQERLTAKYLNRLKYEEKLLSNESKLKEAEIQKLLNEKKQLQKEYEQIIKAIYINSGKSELELILSSASVNQALIRLRYLEKFSDDRKRKSDKLIEKQESLIKEKQNLDKIITEKRKIKSLKESEENLLVEKIKEKREIIKGIKYDRESLIAELDKKKRAEKEIQSIIADLIRREKIERERRKREMEKEREKLSVENKSEKKENVIASEKKSVELSEFYDEYSSFSSLASLKGRLPWPVSKGRIINRFGENRNEQLNTVTLNFGIDIGTPFNSDVKSISDGVVSVIHWLQGYGNIVIIRHGEEFRTVYAGLSSVLVNEGDHVKAGTTVGKSGESLAGEMIHFEIWRERDKQNPEIWLSKK